MVMKTRTNADAHDRTRGLVLDLGYLCVCLWGGVFGGVCEVGLRNEVECEFLAFLVYSK